MGIKTIIENLKESIDTALPRPTQSHKEKFIADSIFSQEVIEFMKLNFPKADKCIDQQILQITKRINSEESTPKDLLELSILKKEAELLRTTADTIKDYAQHHIISLDQFRESIKSIAAEKENHYEQIKSKVDSPTSSPVIKAKRATITFSDLVNTISFKIDSEIKMNKAQRVDEANEENSRPRKKF